MGVIMKKFFSILSLVWFAASAHAANPSFNSFSTDFFQVTGTGNNSIKIKTNAFTWLNAGPWLLNSGTLSNSVANPVSNLVFSSSDFADPNIAAFQNWGTNVIVFTKHGGLEIGRNVQNIWGTPDQRDMFVGVFDASKGEPTRAYLKMLVTSDDNQTNAVDLEVQHDTPTHKGSWFWNSSYGGTNYSASLVFGASETSFFLRKGSTVQTRLWPDRADGLTPYTLGSSEIHTSGNLLEVNNAGLTPLSINYAGGLLLGSNALAYWGALGGEIMVALRDTGKGDVDNAEMYMGILRGDGAFTGIDSDPRTNTFNWRLVVNNTDRVVLKPTENNGNAPFIFSSSKPHTSGPMLTLKNTNAEILSVDWHGSITPGLSNEADIGSPLLPYRTQYAKAFTVIGSQRTVAYSESGTIVGDYDVLRIRGATPLTTNYVIPAVATLIISNGLIFGITGP
jgi:hypothetical protein